MRGITRATQELGHKGWNSHELFDAIPGHIVMFGQDSSRIYANQSTFDYYGSSFEAWRQETAFDEPDRRRSKQVPKIAAFRIGRTLGSLPTPKDGTMRRLGENAKAV
jgi:hypothetical protein